LIVTTRLLYNVQYPVPYLSRLQRIYPLQYCGITIRSLPPAGPISGGARVRWPPDTVFSGHFAAPTFKDASYPAQMSDRPADLPPSRGGNEVGAGRTPPFLGGGDSLPSRGTIGKRSPSPPFLRRRGRIIVA
jgi:hypothetical protein